MKIKVLVVDDSALFRQMIIQHLSSKPNIEVVGYAINAYDAKQKIPQLKPDVLTLDVEMPGLNGIEFLKQLLPTTPLPVVLVSSLNLSVFDALSAGAVDFVRKPDMSVANSKNTFRLPPKRKSASRRQAAAVHLPLLLRSRRLLQDSRGKALLRDRLLCSTLLPPNQCLSRRFRVMSLTRRSSGLALPQAEQKRLWKS